MAYSAGRQLSKQLVIITQLVIIKTLWEGVGEYRGVAAEDE